MQSGGDHSTVLQRAQSIPLLDTMKKVGVNVQKSLACPASASTTPSDRHLSGICHRDCAAWRESVVKPGLSEGQAGSNDSSWTCPSPCRSRIQGAVPERGPCVGHIQGTWQ